MQRKGPKGAVSLYSNKPTHVLIRARISDPPAFGSSNTSGTHTRKTTMEENNRLLLEKNRIDRERKKQMLLLKEEKRRYKIKQNQMLIHDGSTSLYSRRPHRVLGSAPAIKRPSSPNPLLDATPNMHHLLEHQEKAFESFDARGNGKHSNWHHNSPGGRGLGKPRRCRSAGRYRNPEKAHNRGLTPNPSQLYNNSDALQVSLKQRTTRGSSKKKNKRRQRPHTTTMLAKEKRNEAAEVDSFAMFGYAERGVAVRREQGDALAHVTAGTGNTIDDCFGGGSNSNMEQQMMENQQQPQRQMSRLHNKNIDTSMPYNNKDGSASKPRNPRTQMERPHTASKTLLKIKRSKKKRLKKKRSKSAAAGLAVKDTLNRLTIPSVSPMGRDRSKKRLASAGRDRKAQALFDRYFKVNETSGDDGGSESWNSSSSSSSNGRGHEKKHNNNNRNNPEEQDDAIIDWSLGTPVPGVVLIKTPNWKKYLVPKK
jgi:hypothetical protein